MTTGDLTCAQNLQAAVERATPLLLAIDDLDSVRHPAPGKWSPREVIGHLIDSASNNHQRFVRAQLQDDLVFVGYQQDMWVEVQRYQQAPWSELVTLWRLFNLHLARVMAAAPAAARLRPRRRHNLDEIAWTAVPSGESVTLDYFMNDYVDHMKHHVRQILGATWQ